MSGLLFLSFLSLLFTACVSDNTAEQIQLNNSDRMIKFSGYDWVVRTSEDGKKGPGPNYFSDSEDNVWVDEQGRLHLKIVKKDGKWLCSGVTLRRSMGYNKYVFYVGSRVDNLDINVVGGLFTYMNDEEEIDIEFSKWSQINNQDSQFAVQPSHNPGNKTRFNLNLDSEFSTHFFDWKQHRIEFASYRGHTLNPDISDVISEWTYSGKDIPPDSDEQLKINLWLFRGKPPTDGKEAEMIIDKVEIY